MNLKFAYFDLYLHDHSVHVNVEKSIEITLALILSKLHISVKKKIHLIFREYINYYSVFILAGYLGIVINLGTLL